MIRSSTKLLKKLTKTKFKFYSTIPVDAFSPKFEGNNQPIDYPTPVVGDPYWGLSSQGFDERVTKTLLAPINPQDVEIKPDGILYLPEIKYRKVLNNAFGPGGWCLLPRGNFSFNSEKTVLYRQFALYVYGRFVSQSIGEQDYIQNRSIATTLEATKSNALMRCCKDLGIASELWDPEFVLDWKIQYALAVWCQSVKPGGDKIPKRRLWRRKDRIPFEYPWKEVEIK